MCNHFYLANNGANDISSAVMNQLVSIMPFCETIMLNGDGEPFLSSNIVENINIEKGLEIKNSLEIKN